MDVPQLKLLAARVRELLSQQERPVSHGQSLDLIAALPGLRNWPEVAAFPERVAACDVGEATTARLARRIEARHGLALSAADLLNYLAPERPDGELRLPELWPSGPRPGVYVTTSQSAIEKAMARYDDGTDGAPLYAEEAGDRFDSAIGLGDGGLWSLGLRRVPSGTLIVVGPLEMTQRDWERNSERLQQACLIALLDNHRVVVLFNTPAPDQLHSDATLLARSDEPSMDDLHEALRGVVTEDGELRAVAPFVGVVPRPRIVAAPRSEVVLPTAVGFELRKAMERQRFGFVVLGSNVFHERRAELLEALLPFTEFAGPVARIYPEHQHGYDGDPPLSSRFSGIPVMPSIESAYAHGYRRMVLEKFYGETDELLSHAKNVCFLLSSFGAETDSAFFHAFSPRSSDEIKALEQLIAAVGIAVVDGKKGEVLLADVYVKPAEVIQANGDSEAALAYIRDHRVLRWENDLDEALRTRAVTAAQVKHACRNHQAMHRYLAGPSRRSKAAVQ